MQGIGWFRKTDNIVVVACWFKFFGVASVVSICLVCFVRELLFEMKKFKDMQSLFIIICLNCC